MPVRVVKPGEHPPRRRSVADLERLVVAQGRMLEAARAAFIDLQAEYRRLTVEHLKLRGHRTAVAIRRDR